MLGQLFLGKLAILVRIERIEGFGDIAGRFPQNKYHTAPPTGLVVRTRINRYEPGRLHIAVYNWDEQDEVEVDIAAAQLPEGAHYEIRNAQHFFGDPVMQGVYDGNPRIRVPMRGLVSAPPPIGKADALVPQTAPRFAVFVLVPRAPAPSLTPR